MAKHPYTSKIGVSPHFVPPDGRGSGPQVGASSSRRKFQIIFNLKTKLRQEIVGSDFRRPEGVQPPAGNSGKNTADATAVTAATHRDLSNYWYSLVLIQTNECCQLSSLHRYAGRLGPFTLRASLGRAVVFFDVSVKI